MRSEDESEEGGVVCASKLASCTVRHSMNGFSMLVLMGLAYLANF